jgi:two-component system, OmpR family, sensor kinase
MKDGTVAAARLLDALEELQEIPPADLRTALVEACNVVAKALGADKVDAFLYQPHSDSLVAIGSSTQPLSALEKRSGLDVLARANGGRAVWVYDTGKTFHSGRLDLDTEELRGVKSVLGVKSIIGVPIVVAERARGMMLVASQTPELFTADDVRFAETIVRWVGSVVHRAELIEELSRNAVEQGRRAAAEELVTTLAHDLRALISPIAMRLELIRGRERPLPSRDREDAENALVGLERLKRLITDLLDVARIDQGLFQLSLGPVDLVRCARDVARTLATPKHAIQVRAEDEVIVLADPDRLRQCIENLLANAIQHSPVDAPVHVVVATEERDDGPYGRIDVQDQGPGVPPEVLPRIFERFASGKQSKGLGLGLFLAHRIATAHGGELCVETRPGEGARFTLKVPAAADRDVAE